MKHILEAEIKTLDAVIEAHQKLRKEKQAELDKINSIDFIKENGITLYNTHNTNIDDNFDYVHDNDKFDRLVMENITKPWFSVDGYIYKTEIVKLGGSRWSKLAGTPALLKDLEI